MSAAPPKNLCTKITSLLVQKHTSCETDLLMLLQGREIRQTAAPSHFQPSASVPSCQDSRLQANQPMAAPIHQEPPGQVLLQGKLQSPCQLSACPCARGRAQDCPASASPVGSQSPHRSGPGPRLPQPSLQEPPTPCSSSCWACRQAPCCTQPPQDPFPPLGSRSPP